MEKVFLHTNWKLYEDSIGCLPAVVPGCVHTDLMACGIIQDIYWRDNSTRYQWIEDRNWTYSCSFGARLGEKVYLVFEGLDTYADIFLNGVLLGKADDMFISHSYDLTEMLREKDNLLEVRFRSPIREIAGKPELFGAFNRERLHSRRIQCTYGWDWVDRFVTCGIYRDVYLQYAKDMYAESVYVYTENVDAFSAQLFTRYEFANSHLGGQVQVKILAPNGDVVAQTAFYADQPQMVRRIDIGSPQLWYPHGYGQQPLYRILVQVGENCLEEHFGIRTLKVLQLPDVPGGENWEKASTMQETEIGKINSHNKVFSGFQVIVNGVKIFCKGANWVPCEPFPSAETEEKIRELVRQAKTLDMNMLRVWGGGAFEKKAFYDACDQAGILVCQDFMMACGNVPEKEEWFIEAVKKEGVYAAKMLRNHPCLAWWHCDNENGCAGSDTREDYPGRTVYLRSLAPAIYEHDHFRQIFPSSPCGGERYASATCGTAHNTNYIWDIFQYFHQKDCADYKEFFGGITGRFVAEEPVFGCVSTGSLKKFLSEADVFSDETEEMMKYHSRTNPDLPLHLYDYVREFTEKVLGPFKDPQDRIFKYQYIQYEWLRVLFEVCRRNHGYCNGEIFWMLNDCWPAALGWSLIDYYGIPKAAWYSFKRCAKPLVASVEKENDGWAVTVSNDGTVSGLCNITAHCLNIAEDLREEAVCTLTCLSAEYGAVECRLPWAYTPGKLIVCDILSEDCEDRCFYKDGDLHIVSAGSDLQILERGENHIVLQADRYIHVVALEGAYIFQDNYFSMYQGEHRKIVFSPLSEKPEAFTVNAYTMEGK